MDKTDCGRLPGCPEEHGERLAGSIRRRAYRPSPVLRAETPKCNGKKRRSGMPAVAGRVIQQAIAQALAPIYERRSGEGSRGFRPRGGGKKALAKATGTVGQSCRYAAGTGLERFFGTVDRAKMTETLQRAIKGDAVISLVRKCLNAGVMANGKHEETREGTPRGGPLGPLPADMPPDELDKELERRRHPFARHADDGLIFCKSRRAAERVKKSIYMESMETSESASAEPNQTRHSKAESI